ncbi:MAG TPA: PAS domain S-box protein [Terriglobales bacterium]|nr:PAS domain S-box protein [Terriglobales bacterium]
MNPIHVTPKIEELRRLKKFLDRQIVSRTADLNKINESLREEITKLKDKLREQEARAKEQTAERARTEQALGQSERRYHLMADATPVLLWQSGVDRLCTYFNNRWLEFTGRTMEQELGNGWTEGVHPDDYQRCLDIYTSAFKRHQPFAMEYRLRHRSGDYRWVLDRGAPLRSPAGTFLGYIGGCIDIHDRKLAEKGIRDREAQLRHSLELNQSIMANMAEGLYTVNTRGLVTYMNPAAERLFGWSSAELLGRKMHDLTHYRHPDGSYFPADECPALQVLQKETVLSNHEDVFVHKDGTLFDVIYSSAPIRSDDGAVIGLVLVFRDVTARKETEKTLRTSRRELRALAARLQAAREEERAVLAREIHDELSGTLTALKMDLSLLPDRATKDRDLFLEKLNSMSGLIDCALAHVHAIVTELRPVVLDKLGLIAAIEWQAGEFHERSGIVCEMHLPTEDIPLDSDRSTALFRIFQEALTNVARHANATKVVVDLRTETTTLILTVRDNGKGIDEKVIFDQNSLGLLGMRERALSFGGTAEVATLPRRGTLVTVRVPIE